MEDFESFLAYFLDLGGFICWNDSTLFKSFLILFWVITWATNLTNTKKKIVFFGVALSLGFLIVSWDIEVDGTFGFFISVYEYVVNWCISFICFGKWG